jgi:hypothetical protein
VNLAFFGVLWHAGRMVLSPGNASSEDPRPHEQSRWMIAAMLACLLVVIVLGVHLPSALVTLLGHARHLLLTPGS